VSGQREAIEELERWLEKESVGYRRLKTKHGFHSVLMEPVLEEYRAEVGKVRLREAQRRYLSNVSGSWAGKEVRTPEYWVKHMREPVEFDAGLKEVAKERAGIVVEVGPGQTLRRLALREAQGRRLKLAVASMPGSGKTSEQETMLNALGRLWEAGIAVDWKQFHSVKKTRVPLPTYPFERHRYWIDPPSRSIKPVPCETPNTPEREIKPAAVAANSRPKLRNDYVPPRSETERRIVAIVERALGIQTIGVTDKFGELGGDSLIAASVIAEINSAIGCSLRVADLFEQMTARALADHLSDQSKDVPQSDAADMQRIAQRKNYRAHRDATRPA
jgi:acyl transferase domain-containing protein